MDLLLDLVLVGFSGDYIPWLMFYRDALWWLLSSRDVDTINLELMFLCTFNFWADGAFNFELMELMEFMEIEPFVFLKLVVLNVCSWNNLIIGSFLQAEEQISWEQIHWGTLVSGFMAWEPYLYAAPKVPAVAPAEPGCIEHLGLARHTLLRRKTVCDYIRRATDRDWRTQLLM